MGDNQRFIRLPVSSLRVLCHTSYTPNITVIVAGVFFLYRRSRGSVPLMFNAIGFTPRVLKYTPFRLCCSGEIE